MSNQAPAALYKQDEQKIPLPVELNFKFDGTVYRVKLLLDTIPALASIPCEMCGKTTRQIQQSYNVDIPADDQQVNILDIVYINDVNNEAKKTARSIEDANFVSIIDSVVVENIEDIDSMIEISDGDTIWIDINKHIQEKLPGRIVCDGCNYINKYLDNLLED